MKRVIHFIRKSTVGQEIDHQENLLNETSKQNGWEVVEVIRETISGTKKNEDRRGIVHLQDIISLGGIDLVVVWEKYPVYRVRLEIFITFFLSFMKEELDCISKI
jgi:DNA invertase Pin-like site-specific DNA recombinase